MEFWFKKKELRMEKKEKKAYYTQRLILYTQQPKSC